MQQIVIIDDHQLFSSGLVLLLQELPREISVLSFMSAADCLSSMTESPDLIVLDFYVPGTSFTDTVIALLKQFSSPILVVSASPSTADRTTAKHAGAVGFVSKHSAPETLLDAVETVLNGGQVELGEDTTPAALEGFDLTPRQVEILLLVSKGCSNKEIGNLLDVSAETIKSHLKTVFKRIEVQSRIEAVEFIRERGLM